MQSSPYNIWLWHCRQGTEDRDYSERFIFLIRFEEFFFLLLNVTKQQHFFSRLDFREGFKIALDLSVAFKGIIEDRWLGFAILFLHH